MVTITSGCPFKLQGVLGPRTVRAFYDFQKELLKELDGKTVRMRVPSGGGQDPFKSTYTGNAASTSKSSADQAGG